MHAVCVYGPSCFRRCVGLYCVLMCSTGLHAVEDPLHLPRMLHDPSGQVVRLQECCAAVLADADSEMIGGTRLATATATCSMLRTHAGSQSGCIAAQATCSCSHAAGHLPDLPRTLHKPSTREAAYARAGLAHWAVALTDREEPAESAAASNVQQQRQAPAAGRRDGPGMVVAVSLAGLVVTLPYDEEPGPSERFVELWAKAFKQVGMWRRRKIPVGMHPSWLR